MTHRDRTGRDPRQANAARVRRQRRALLVLGIAVLAVFGTLGASWANEGLSKREPARPAPSGQAPGDPVVVAHAKTDGCDACHKPPRADHYSAACSTCHAPGRPFSEPQLTHVTFGAHKQATQACSTCHTGQPAAKIACRSCHGDRCGKDAKTVADCLECHRSGTTAEWVPR